ncbi:MAG: RNA polymerase sigma-70 factor [Prevotella sp.]|nr:RNA polymerase sigma-70 factor [Prevotella sp.]
METTRKIQFKQVFEKYYPVLCQIAHGYISDPDDCEDVVQELFVSVWNRGKDTLPENELAAYLKTAVRNNCISLLRQRQRMETVSMDDKPLVLADSPADDGPAADYEVLLETILAAMPPKCRDVFMMSKFQKMKYKEIAEALHISEKTVENHIGKAFKIIRSYAAQHPVMLLIIALSHLMNIGL